MQVTDGCTPFSSFYLETMKQLILLKLLLLILLSTTSRTADAKSTHLWDYGANEGPTTIYVGDRMTFFNPFPSHITSCRWFLRQGTGDSLSESQETGGAKIVSSNLTSCTIQGLWDNTDAYGDWKLELYCIYEGYSEDYVAIWQILVKDKSTPILVKKITLSESSLVLASGEKTKLTATISPSNAANKSVTWSSGNSEIAYVNNIGEVYAINEGITTITCQANDGSGVKNTCSVTVSSPVVAEINETNFPDMNFRNWLLVQDYGKDGKLIEEEIKSVTSLDVSGTSKSPGSIKSLKGIEIFNSLESLRCSDNQLTSLDVSKNTALRYLYCGHNQLTSLDVSKNTALTNLYCGSNQLTSLDVSKNTALTYLDCGSNQLTSLDVSKNTALKDLACYFNQLTSLDVSKNTALTDLNCYSNQLTSIDVSKNTALTDLICSYNQLTSLDVSKNTALAGLECRSNQLTSLDVSKNTVLDYLDCNGNKLTSIDVSKNTALKWLLCYSNQLTSLDVSKNTALKWLYCYRNQIRGASMDALIQSLPTTSTNPTFRLIDNREGDEGNECTKSQVAAAKAKGWSPFYYNGSEWVEYEGSEDPSPSIGSGTENDPFSPAAANEFANSLGANTPTEQVYYVKGKVVSIKEQFGTQYGNATFYISDDGTTANQFYIYKAKYLGNKKYAGEDLVLNVGDEVVVCGKLVNYIGTLPGTVQDEAYVVSINGTKGSTYERGDVNGDGVVNIADLMMLVNILTAK